ncbi:Calcium-activated chloride channel regulator 1 [Nymphon striatum]|nr:Calcium-activated chloride channel regulator 1 [Nymphon striatum]
MKSLAGNILVVCTFGLNLSKVILAHISLHHDGGYGNIAVGISKDFINPDHPMDVKSLVENIDKLFSMTSKKLFEATDGKFYFKSVNVIFPPSWDSDIISSVGPEYKFSTKSCTHFRNTDIRIDKANPLFSDEPYTLQSKGCGNFGHYIHLTLDYILNSQKDLEMKAKDIVHQWAHLRFGVFDEIGYVGDELYPTLYVNSSSDFVPTGCSNVSVSGDIVNDTESGLTAEKTSSANFIPSEKGNEDVQSSLMYLINLPNVTKFCGDKKHAHILEAPTKHNFLCGYKSIWDIIKLSNDFQKISKNVQDVPPVRINVIRSVSKAKMFLHDEGIEDDDYQLIVYSKFATIPSQKFTSLTASKDKIETGCVICAVEKAITVSKSHKLSNFILITDGNVTISDMTRISQLLKNSTLKLYVILSPSKTSLLSKWLTISEQVYIVNENSSLQAAAQIQIRLMAIFNTLNPQQNDQLYGYQMLGEAHKTKSKQLYKGNFTINCDSGYIHLFYHTNTKKTDLQIQIGGQTYKTSDTHFMKTFSYSDFSVVRGYNEYSTKQNDVLVNYFIKFPDLSIDSWTNADDKMSQNEPVAAYVKITSNYRPVIGAEIEATLVECDNQGCKDAMSIFLKDNGNSEPDITANDGIYSGYFIKQMEAQSMFSIKIRVYQSNLNQTSIAVNRTWTDPNCCGSSIPVNKHKPVSLTNIEMISKLYAVNNAIDETKFPPSRILDLKVMPDPFHSDCFSLQWTSPGDQYGSGKVKAYQLAMSKNKTEIITDKNVWKPVDSISPLREGEVQNVSVPKPNGEDGLVTYYIAIRSSSKNTIVSKTSNIVSYTFEIFNPTTVESSFTETPTKISTIIHTTRKTNISTKFPPSRILDLKVAADPQQPENVLLQWTSPGGQYHIGKTPKYQLSISNNRSEITHENVWKNIPNYTPLPKGSTEQIVIPKPRWDDGLATYYFSIRSINDFGVFSPMSNIASYTYTSSQDDLLNCP